MSEEDLALIIYDLADRFGNDGVENGRMVNLLGNDKIGAWWLNKK